MPASIVPPDMAVDADMAGGCAGPQPPCTGHMPSCAGHAGCIALSALPASPVLIAVVFAWTSLAWEPAPESLAGISLKPELSPPILAA